MAVSIEFLGGPKDGMTSMQPKSTIEKFLINVNGTSNILFAIMPTNANQNHLHVYSSGGPIDMPIIETQITLYYKGVKDIDSKICDL